MPWPLNTDAEPPNCAAAWFSDVGLYTNCGLKRQICVQTRRKHPENGK